MANTTNYNWETPDDTDLVKDGAAAIRTLGNSVDTTTKALNPETTLGDIAYRSATSNTNTRLPIGTAGQILAVSGGVPAWINNDQGDITEVQAGTGISVASGTGPIPVVTNTVATEFDAKGDLVVGTGSDTFDRLAVGTNTYILTADSAEATGLKWAAPAVAASGLTFIKAQTVGSGVSSQEVTSAFSATYDNYLITFTGGACSNNGSDLNIQFGATTSGYAFSGFYQSTTSSTLNVYATDSSSSISCGVHSTNGAAVEIFVCSPFLSARTTAVGRSTATNSGDMRIDYAGRLDNTTSYTSFKINTQNTMTGGTIRVYGYQNS